jgi:hypothetical protein
MCGTALSRRECMTSAGAAQRSSGRVTALAAHGARDAADEQGRADVPTMLAATRRRRSRRSPSAGVRERLPGTLGELRERC